MAKPFPQYDYDDARELLGPQVTVDPISLLQPTLRRPLSAQLATNFYEGDHWQQARGFVGELPPLGFPGRPLTVERIRLGFVAENVIQEVTETHVGGILGREPVWSFLDKDADKATASDPASFGNTTAEQLTPWWNERAGLRDLQEATTTLVLEGKVVRRLFVPVGLLPNGTATARDLQSALNFIYFENHTADVAGVFTDPDTQARMSVFLFDETDNEGSVIAHCAELSFLNERGDTVVRVVKDKGAPAQFGPYKLGGHLMCYELDRRALITEQVQSNQRALNLTHTMMMRNVNMAGSRERTVTNAQPPIEIRTTTDSNGAPVTQTQLGTYRVGAGAVNFLMGQPIYDEEGNVSDYTNPNVNITDPAPVDTFIKTGDHYREAIYNQVHQRHVLIVDKADTSGRAREVARREFERSLKETKVVVDASGRWQLETTLRLAAQISGSISQFAPLRADFNCLIDAGEPDPEKQRMSIELRKAGLISAETARNWIGVEDAAAELARIKAEDPTDPSQPAPEETPTPQGATPTPEVSTATN